MYSVISTRRAVYTRAVYLLHMFCLCWSYYLIVLTYTFISFIFVIISLWKTNTEISRWRYTTYVVKTCWCYTNLNVVSDMYIYINISLLTTAVLNLCVYWWPNWVYLKIFTTKYMPPLKKNSIMAIILYIFFF